MGGLSKKAFQIQTLSEQNDKQKLLVDSGNLLFKRNSITDGVNQERLTADSILKIYQNLGYDAVGVGPLDLSGGVEFLRNSSNNGFPWISANIMDDNGKPIFKQWTDKTIQATEIVITALTAAPHQVPTTIQINTWQTILPGLLAQINKEKKDPFIVLLSSLSHKENSLIAEQYSDIHLLISADRHKGNVSPQLVNGCLLTQTAKQGKFQGVLDIILGKKRQWGHNSAKQIADLQNKLGSINWQLSRLQKKVKVAENAEKYKNTITRLTGEKETLNAQIASLDETSIKETTNGATEDQYKYRFIGLKKNLPNDPPTDEILNNLNREIRQLHKKENETARQKDINNAITDDGRMTGFRVCETCHPVQTDFWKTTRHATAYATLTQNNKHLDLECLPCHLTLDMQNANINNHPRKQLLSFPEELQSVGCESCHGAGKDHSVSPEQFKLVRLPDKNLCLTCHTSDHDDNFDYDAKLRQISCPAE